MDRKKYPGIHRVYSKAKVAHLLFDNWGVIGWGSNGGFQAVNLAVQFGASRIVLVGFDMSLEKGTHWHGRHASPLNNPKQAAVDKWRIELDAQAPVLASMGIEVLNASPHSRLTAFRRVPLLEAIRWKSPTTTATTSSGTPSP